MFALITNVFPAIPKQMLPEPISHDVSVKEMINSIFFDITSDGVINFAMAVPDVSLLPAAKLNKSVYTHCEMEKKAVSVMNKHREILN